MNDKFRNVLRIFLSGLLVPGLALAAEIIALYRALAPDERGYRVLEGLNTRPAVTYLKKVRNTAADD